MQNNITTCLSSLHSALSSLNCFMLLAPKEASYPLGTYTILNSKASNIKSFTSEGEVFTVQFSYFDDQSILNCLSLNNSVISALDNLSVYFDLEEGNYTTVASTEQHKYYQLIDTRDIEILKSLI